MSEPKPLNLVKNFSKYFAITIFKTSFQIVCGVNLLVTYLNFTKQLNLLSIFINFQRNLLKFVEIL